MQTTETIRSRRAIKHFDPSHSITETEIKTLFETTILSPTSFNIQNWRFVVVTDLEVKKQLRAAAWDQAQVTEASIVVLICADLQAWARQPERYWANAPEDVRNTLVPMIGDFYKGREQLQRDEAMRSVGIAAQTLMLTAKDMGYDSCPMIGFDSVKVAEIIKLPTEHVIGMMVTVGKALKPARERGGQLKLEEVVFENSF